MENKDFEAGGYRYSQKRKADPIEAIFDSLSVAIEAMYEDSDVSDEEYELAKRRFANALKYMILHTIEEFGNEKE